MTIRDITKTGINVYIENMSKKIDSMLLDNIVEHSTYVGVTIDRHDFIKWVDLMKYIQNRSKQDIDKMIAETTAHDIIVDLRKRNEELTDEIETLQNKIKSILDIIGVDYE